MNFTSSRIDNEYEMTFKDSGSMELVEEDTSDVPVQVNQSLFCRLTVCCHLFHYLRPIISTVLLTWTSLLLEMVASNLM